MNLSQGVDGRGTRLFLFQMTELISDFEVVESFVSRRIIEVDRVNKWSPTRVS